MEWQTFIEVLQLAILLGGTLGSIIFGPRVYKAQKARTATKENARRQSIINDAAKITSVDVAALQKQSNVFMQALAEQSKQLVGQDQQLANQQEAINSLKKLAGEQQIQIVELENENGRLRSALDEARQDRKRLEILVIELQVNKAKLEGQIKAYQQMFEQVVVKSIVVSPTGQEES